MTPDKQAAPSEWVGMYQGNVSALPQCYYDNDHWVEYDDVAQIAAEADSEIAALRAHLESREALLEKERESRKEAQMENVRLKDLLARHGIEARKVLAKREALVKQLADAIRDFLSGGDMTVARMSRYRAALAAYQEKT